MTEDRIIHAVVGLLLLALFYIRRRKKGKELMVVVPMVLLGTWVPDWDLILGIGFHRSPFTHSVLPVLLLWPLRQTEMGKTVVVGMALGVGSHLIWDTIDYGNVVMIPGGLADRLFLLSNMAICIGIAFWFHRSLARQGTPRATGATGAMNVKIGQRTRPATNNAMISPRLRGGIAGGVLAWKSQLAPEAESTEPTSNRFAT